MPNRWRGPREVATAFVVVAIALSASLAAGLAVSTPAIAPYPPLRPAQIAAVNNFFHGVFGAYPPHAAAPYEIVSAIVPSNELATAHEDAAFTIKLCNEGQGTTVIAAGLIRSTNSNKQVLVFFFDPPGYHLDVGGTASTYPPGFYNFVFAFAQSPPSRTCFGAIASSPLLPRLRVHGTKRQLTGDLCTWADVNYEALSNPYVHTASFVYRDGFVTTLASSSDSRLRAIGHSLELWNGPPLVRGAGGFAFVRHVLLFAERRCTPYFPRGP